MNVEQRLNDRRRLAALRRTGAMDSGRERSFDEICRLTSDLLKAPSAFVSLLGADRHYLKSSCGDGDNGVDSFERDVSLDISFCKYVVASGEPWLVDDARENELVRDNDAVRRGVIAYAGVPFTAGGETVGALCVVDSQPRRWTQDDVRKLTALAHSVEKLLAGSDDQPPSAQSSERLFDSLREYFHAVDDYRTTIDKSDLDLEAERGALERVNLASDGLRREFGETSGLLGPGMEHLLLGLRKYFGAEERRRKSAEHFAAGTGTLGDLQTCMFDVSQAEDDLRLAALDSGLTL